MNDRIEKSRHIAKTRAMIERGADNDTIRSSLTASGLTDFELNDIISAAYSQRSKRDWLAPKVLLISGIISLLTGVSITFVSIKMTILNNGSGIIIIAYGAVFSGIVEIFLGFREARKIKCVDSVAVKSGTAIKFISRLVLCLIFGFLCSVSMMVYLHDLLIGSRNNLPIFLMFLLAFGALPIGITFLLKSQIRLKR